MVSDKLSQNSSIVWRCFSVVMDKPMPNNMLNSTICSTCPSATDLAMFSGNMWRIMSVKLCLLAGRLLKSACVGICKPTPAWLMLMAIKPIASATVVTTSKYSKDFQPIRPTCFKSECPAMPTTKVPNKSGAIILLMSNKNTLLNTCRLCAKAGKLTPISIPTAMANKMLVVSDFLVMV